MLHRVYPTVVDGTLIGTHACSRLHGVAAYDCRVNAASQGKHSCNIV